MVSSQVKQFNNTDSGFLFQTPLDVVQVCQPSLHTEIGSLLKHMDGDFSCHALPESIGLGCLSPSTRCSALCVMLDCLEYRSKQTLDYTQRTGTMGQDGT